MNDKKYSLSNNVFFLLRMIRKYLPMSFVFVIIDIPLAVFLDYVGVRIPNLIVGMIQGYSVSVGIIVAYGIASVVAAVILQYGNRMVSAQAPQLCAKLDLKLFEKYRIPKIKVNPVSQEILLALSKCKYINSFSKQDDYYRISKNQKYVK